MSRVDDFYSGNWPLTPPPGPVDPPPPRPVDHCRMVKFWPRPVGPGGDDEIADKEVKVESFRTKYVTLLAIRDAPSHPRDQLGRATARATDVEAVEEDLRCDQKK